MNKKLLVIPVIVLVLTMLLAVTGFACDTCDCGCGCDCVTYCSPGYWKNHTDWQSDPQWATSPWGDADDMLDILWAKGNSDLFQYRFAVADALNEVGYPWADCD